MYVGKCDSSVSSARTRENFRHIHRNAEKKQEDNCISSGRIQAIERTAMVSDFYNLTVSLLFCTGTLLVDECCAYCVFLTLGHLSHAYLRPIILLLRVPRNGVNIMAAAARVFNIQSRLPVGALRG